MQIYYTCFPYKKHYDVIIKDKNDTKKEPTFFFQVSKFYDVPLEISVTRLKLLFQPRHSAVGCKKKGGGGLNQQRIKGQLKIERRLKKPLRFFQVSTMCSSSISQGSQQKPYSLYPSLPLCKWDLAHGAPAPTYSAHRSMKSYLTQVRIWKNYPSPFSLQ